MGENSAMLPTPPSPVEGFDPEVVLKKLTTTEKIDLLSGTVIMKSSWLLYTFSHSKGSISGTPNLSPGWGYHLSDCQMGRMESGALVFSMALPPHVSHAVLLWVPPGTPHFSRKREL